MIRPLVGLVALTFLPLVPEPATAADASVAADVTLARSLMERAWRGESDHGTVRHRCRTPLVLQAWRIAQRLPPAERGKIFPATAGGRVDLNQQAIVAVDSVCPTDSAEAPICVHTTTAGEVQLATDVWNLAQQAWTIEVDNMGFRPALPDNDIEAGPEIDIYLTPAGGGGFTAPESSTASVATAEDDAAAYIVIDDLIDISLMGAFVAHELHHAIQFAYDTEEWDTAYESGAVFIEDKVFTNINGYTDFVAQFQSTPENAVDYFPGFQSNELEYSYGAAAFLFFISENYDNGGTGLVRSMWEASAQSTGTNEPDYFDALDTVVPSGLDSAYSEFSQWRAFTGSNAVSGSFFNEGASWASPAIAASHTLTQMPVQGGTTTTAPMEYGANYIEVSTSGAIEGDRLLVHIDGDTAVDWALSVTGIPSDGEPCAVTVSASGGSADAYVDGLNAYNKVIVVVANIGSGSRDPDDQNEATSSFAYDLTYAEDSAEIDIASIEGCVAVDGEPIGCAECSIAKRGPRSPFDFGASLLVLALVGMIAVFRRERARRASR